MKKYLPLLPAILVMSIISGILMSKPSLVGRVGIDLFYREYRFLRVWWQGALVVFTVLFLLFLLHRFIEKKIAFSKARILYLIILLAGALGFYLTWQDFHQDLSHRWLRERFHFGAYMFWTGWLIICTFFLFQKPEKIMA